MTARAADPLAQEFVRFAVDAGVLRFGEFKTKAGRLSPYFFNAGCSTTAPSWARLADHSMHAACWPAASHSTCCSARPTRASRWRRRWRSNWRALGRNVPFAFNRKEAKDHGEGGTLVGAPVRGRVLIVDDVISAGTSVRESIALITAAGATPCGVALALDRQEKAVENGRDADHSAVQFVTRELGLPVTAVATLDDLLQYLAPDPSLQASAAAVQAYRDRYGV
jgi:orotate phosphoribosyltransferase